ncbi:hypothetical protein [Bradyrhizobium elkanii]|uniref:hypothetical protein n=1 Tax=Bradyrhizobium elkanii TaxID=29448 RepID=UPI0035170607
MTRQKNRGVVFTGTLKSALRRPSPRKFCTPKRKARNTALVLEGGPLHNKTVYMSDHSCTLPITMGGQTGRYVGHVWQPA